MIKSISVTNHLGESITLELRFPEKSGFLVQGVEGLGPAKANINTTEFASNDGAMYNSARVMSRNIVLTLKFLDVPTIEVVRQKSYKYFPLKKRVKVRVETDTRICETYGYIESNEPTIFSKSTSTTVSIICPDPYLYSEFVTSTIFSGAEATFEFPFENLSLVAPLLELGTITVIQDKNVYYSGDAEIGVVMTIHAIGNATNVTIYNTETGESMAIDTNILTDITGSGIIAGDDIVITTTKGKKSIKLLRGGATINILNCLAIDTDWFQLSKGDNVFAVLADTGLTNLQFKIENQTVYEGV